MVLSVYRLDATLSINHSIIISTLIKSGQLPGPKKKKRKRRPARQRTTKVEREEPERTLQERKGEAAAASNSSSHEPCPGQTSVPQPLDAST